MCTEPHHHPGTVAASAIRPESIGTPSDPVTLTPVDAGHADVMTSSVQKMC